MSYTDKTREFYRAFKQHMPPEGTLPSLEDSVIPEQRLHLKMTLIAEEFAELVGAVYGDEASKTVYNAFLKAVAQDDYTRDIVEAADATADMRVVLDGFDIEAAIPTEQVFDEVFRSNMSKLDNDGNPIICSTKAAPLGKIMKSDNYTPPDIAGVLFGKKNTEDEGR